MKQVAMLLMLLSLGLFSVGCAPPAEKKEETKTETPAASEEGHEHAEGEEHMEGEEAPATEEAPAAEAPAEEKAPE